MLVLSDGEANPLVGEMCYPILGIDLWEHSYYLYYFTEVNTYIQYYWAIIDWALIETFYESYASKGLPVPV